MIDKLLVYPEVPMLRPVHSHQVFATPNAVMTTAAAPSSGSSELAVWRVEMVKGQVGPAHIAHQEQVWVVLSGTMTCRLGADDLIATAGDAIVMPAGAQRQVRVAGEGFQALVSSVAGATVATPGADDRPLPWAS